jgi:drug/metabolite transporter (DMT)-like permease
MSASPLTIPMSADERLPSSRSAWLYACSATTLWAANVIPLKLALREVDSLPTALMRLSLAGIVLLLIHFVRGKSLSALTGSLKEFLLLGLFGITLSFLCFTMAMQTTSVSHAVFISALVPLLVLAVVCIQGKERLTVGKMAGFILALAGIVLLEIDRTTVAAGTGMVASSGRGDLLAFVGACCFAFYTIRGRHLAARYDSATVNTVAFGMGAGIALPLLAWMLFSGPSPAVNPAWNHVSWVAWTSILISGSMGSALPYFIYCHAMRRLRATQVATLSYVQPVIATLLGVMFLGEQLGPQFRLAAALILLGVFIAERR